MNGITTVYPRHVPNICKCGHDFTRHLPNVGGFPSCSDCLTTTATPQRHGFTGKKESWPSAYFPQSLPYGYFAAGGLGRSGIVAQTANTNQNAGNTTVILSTVANVLPGMSMLVILPTPVNAFVYLILSVDHVANTVTIPVPGLRIVSNNVPVIFWGAFGSMMGPGLAANNQRGG